MSTRTSTDGSRAFIGRAARRLATSRSSRATRAEADGLVRRGQRAAFVVIKPGFGAGSERMFYGEPRQLEIGSDPARQAEPG